MRVFVGDGIARADPISVWACSGARRPNSELIDFRKVRERLSTVPKKGHPEIVAEGRDGNDPRGIDVAILSRFPITRMRSHLFDRTDGRPTFSRDCPEYYVELTSGEELVVLPNHFASKGSDKTGARRKVQAAAVRAIYQGLRKQKHHHVLVAGDLNDFPESGALDALLEHTDLKVAMSLPMYEGLPGTYQHATAKEKIDYLPLSPELRSVCARSTCSGRASTRRRMGVVREHRRGDEGSVPGVGPPLRLDGCRARREADSAGIGSADV